VFVNLAAYTKMVIDVEDGRTKPTVAEKERLSQAGLLKHFNNIGQQSVLLSFRPDIDDFYFDEDAAAKMKRKAKEKDEHHPDDDNLIGCIRPPPGVDARKLPKTMFDDWHAAELRDNLFSSKNSVKGKTPASS
jgi:hypothetical protein